MTEAEAQAAKLARGCPNCHSLPTPILAWLYWHAVARSGYMPGRRVVWGEA
jgi:hypothetical protein